HEFSHYFPRHFHGFKRFERRLKRQCAKGTFRTYDLREHRLYGCGAQQSVCHKTPDINQLSVPSGKVHTSLPTPCLALIDGRSVCLYVARTGEERYGTIGEAHRQRLCELSEEPGPQPWGYGAALAHPRGH